MTDPYAVLAVERNADERSIRRAYRDLARRYHPDLGGDERQMIRINEAWQTLGTAERRAAYDAEAGRQAAKPQQSRDGHTVLDFGRYEGWSLADVASHDDAYLEWLQRTPIGRPFRAEIDDLLTQRAAGLTAARRAPAKPKRRWGFA
jgi:curved DNA-binding protein CbpA